MHYSIETQIILNRATIALDTYERAGNHIYAYSDPTFAIDIAKAEVGTSADPTGTRYANLKAKWHIILAADAMMSDEDAVAATATAEEAEQFAAKAGGELSLVFTARTAREWAQECTWLAKQRNQRLREWLHESRKIHASLKIHSR